MQQQAQQNKAEKSKGNGGQSTGNPAAFQGSGRGAGTGRAGEDGQPLSAKNSALKGIQIPGAPGKDGMGSLASPVGGGSSAYVSRERAQGSVPYGAQGAGGVRSPPAGGQMPMADMTSPRNAIGGISGVGPNQ